MNQQFLYESLIPAIVLVIIALLCAEFIGRSKHIGRKYTFFMMLGIIPGIVAISSSPSAKNQPTKGSGIHVFFAIILGIGCFSTFYSNIDNLNIIISFVGLSLGSSSLYLLELSKGQIINYSPKFYFDKKSEFKSINIDKPNNTIENLTHLKEKGILTTEEYNSKIEKVKAEITEQDLKNSTEYKQLNSLLDTGILTKDEFDKKIILLKSKENIDKNYRIVDGYSEGLALVIDENLEYGYIDIYEKIVIDFIFEHAENFSNGVARVRIDGEFKNIDYNGNIIK